MSSSEFILVFILIAIWLFLPAGIANAIPIPISKVPVLRNWNAPVDLGRSFKGIRIFGSHKTWRGLLIGVLFGIITAVLQKNYIVGNPDSALAILVNMFMHDVNPFLWGFLLGFGALLGDMVKSFFKRRVGVKPGKAWFPFDQIDYIVGGVLMSLLYVRLDWPFYVAIFVVWFLMHLLFTFIGWVVKLKDSPI